MAYSWGSPISLIGPQGQNGPAGLSFLTTTGGAPTVAGSEGQGAVDTKNFIIYTYTGGAWVAGPSFRGVIGMNGVNSAFFYGQGAPTSSTFNGPGSAVYFQSNGEIWTFSGQQNAVWVDTGENFTGGVGPVGRRGSVLFEGSGPPPSDPTTLTVGDVHGALPGDTYRDTSTAGGPYEYYFS